MATKGVCVLRGAFVEKEKVKIVERTTDYPPVHEDALGEVVKTVSPKDGEVKVEGLEVGTPYWAVQVVDGQVRSRGFTAHEPDVYKEAPSQKPPKPTGAVPGGYADVSVEGARSTSAIPKLHEPQGAQAEAAPYKGVADVKGEKLSDTPMGSGHPAVEDKESPHLAQSEVKKGTKQLSDTPLGEATPIEDAQTQEDVTAKTKQESATPEGVATPVDPADLPKPKRDRAAEKRSRAAKKAAATRKRRGKGSSRSSARSSGGSRKTGGKK